MAIIVFAKLLDGENRTICFVRKKISSNSHFADGHAMLLHSLIFAEAKKLRNVISKFFMSEMVAFKSKVG